MRYESMVRTLAVATVFVGLSATLGCGGEDGTGADGAVVGRDGGPAAEGGPGPDEDGGPAPGGRAIGDACETDAQCTDPPDARCYTDFDNPFGGGGFHFPNGFCSKPCEEADECGGDNACAQLSMSGGGGGSTLRFCTPPCEGPEDCRASEGYRCTMIFGFGFCSPP